MNERKFYVYLLFRPDGRPCYIGKGSSNRINQHDWPKNHPNRHLAAIIGSSATPLPRVILVDGLTEDEAFEREKLWISTIGRKSHGGPLVNQSDGGEGQTGYRHREDTKKKIAIRSAAREWTDEQRSNLSRALLNSPHRHKFADAGRGRVKPGSPIALKIGAALKGKKKSPEHIAALAASRKVSAPTIAHCRAMAQKGAEASKALWKDPEYKARILASRAAARARKKAGI